MDPECVGALVSLGILELNLHLSEANRFGVQMLPKAIYKEQNENENCLKEFYLHNYGEFMQYLARVYFHAGKLEEAKTMLLKARRVTPQDTVSFALFSLF